MKALKIIGLILLIVIGGAVAWSFFLPAEVNVERSIRWLRIGAAGDQKHDRHNDGRKGLTS